MFKTYFWEWQNHKISIRTFQGIEIARQKALKYFPNDEIAYNIIVNTEPLITDDE